MSAAVMAADSWVAEMNVVLRSAPFQRTIEPATKSLPLTVSAKADPPAVAWLGASAFVAGTGLVAPPPVSRSARLKLS